MAAAPGTRQTSGYGRRFESVLDTVGNTPAIRINNLAPKGVEVYVKAEFFKTLRQTAEQLTPMQRWCRVLSRALVKYLNGRQLRPPALLPAPS